MGEVWYTEVNNLVRLEAENKQDQGQTPIFWGLLVVLAKTSWSVIDKLPNQQRAKE